MKYKNLIKLIKRYFPDNKTQIKVNCINIAPPIYPEPYECCGNGFG